VRNLGGNLGYEVSGGSDHWSNSFTDELTMKKWYG